MLFKDPQRKAVCQRCVIVPRDAGPDRQRGKRIAPGINQPVRGEPRNNMY